VSQGENVLISSHTCKNLLGVCFDGRVTSWIYNTHNLRIIVGNRFRVP